MRESPKLLQIINKSYMESGELHEGLLQLMPIAVYTTNEEGLITFFNSKAAELWGREPKKNDPDEMLFCGSWRLYEPDGSPLLHENSPMARAIREKRKIIGEEICIERPDGSRKFALVNIDLIYDKTGFLTGAVNVLNDITERKKYEKDVNWLAAIVSSSDDAIVSKDLNGIITSWNAGAEKIFGYTAKEIVGKPIHTLIPVNKHSEEDEILSKIRSGQKVDHFETTRVKKNGKKVYVSLTISPIKNSKNEIIGASKIARDITKQVKVKRQLEKYNRQLKQLNSLKDDFIGLASHELKTPLTIIKAHLQLLELEVTDEGLKALLGKTLHHADKLTDLVSDLLDVSRIKEGRLSLSFTTFDLSELIDECISSIEMTEATHKFFRNGFTDSMLVRADRSRIEQVVFNLLTNAVKYSRGKNKVIVNTEAEQDKVVVKVEDFGIGIPDDQLEKVFSRFFRVNGQANKYSGLGIGLYISKEIIDRHKGRIWVESEEGKGSVFTFEIPIAQN